MVSTRSISLILQSSRRFGHRRLQTSTSGIAVGSIFCTPFCHILVVSPRCLGSFWPICSLQVSQRASEVETSGSTDASYTFGFGTGLLAAATVSCCPTPEQLLPAALETVLISFRIGLLAANTRDQIIVDKSTLKSWRVKIQTGETETVLHQLEEFCAQKVDALQSSATVS